MKIILIYSLSRSFYTIFQSVLLNSYSILSIWGLKRFSTDCIATAVMEFNPTMALSLSECECSLSTSIPASIYWIDLLKFVN